MNNEKDKAPNTNIITDLLNILMEIVQILIKEMMNLIILFVKWSFEKGYIWLKGEKRKSIEENKITNTKTTLDSDCIGLDLNTNQKTKFSEIPFKRHTLIFGGTGFGKSTAINNIIDYQLQENNPIILFDPKGNKSALLEFAGLCQYYNKEAILFSELICDKTFNPLKGLNDSQISTMIENAFEWGDGEARFYRDSTLSLLTRRVYDEIRSEGNNISFPEIYRKILKYAEDKEEKETIKVMSGFFSQLSILMKSPFGKLLEDLNDEAISLMEVIEQKRCVYFGLSVMGYGGISKTLGKIFLSELQMHTHELGVKFEDNSIGGKNPICVIIDEAGSLYFKSLINLQNKGRSSGIQLVLATQTMADFEQIDPILLKQIINNTGCFFAFSQSNNEDAEHLAKMIGTYHTTKVTNVTDEGKVTEKGSIREVREYYVHPEVIKNLKVGQCVLFTKDPSQNFLLAIRDSNLLPSLVAGKKMRTQLIEKKHPEQNKKDDTDLKLNPTNEKQEDSELKTEASFLNKFMTENKIKLDSEKKTGGLS